VLGVSALEAIAAAVPTNFDRAIAVMDALRGDFVVQPFARPVSQRGEAAPWMAATGSEEMLSAEEWLPRLKPGNVVTGPGLAKLIDRLPRGIIAADRKYWSPTAANVGRLAHRHWLDGQRGDVWKLVPHYCRPSAAEEKWQEEMASSK
jgi:tRNA A37 threonylcarbamoyladenosine modification protein TsaB